MKLFIIDFFSKCDQIRSFLLSHLLRILNKEHCALIELYTAQKVKFFMKDIVVNVTKFAKD